MKTLMNVALILATLASVDVGQGKANVDRLGEKISNHLKSKLLGWKHKRLEPFGRSSSVLEQSWSSGNSIVMVAVAIRKSPEDANARIS